VRTIAVLNQKGGVGKTTTVANMAAALAMNGQRVLVIDLDPQAHLTIHLGADRDTAAGAYDVLVRNVPLADAMQEVRPRLWLLGANIDLVGAESELVSVVGREIILREALEPVRDRFDYLFIDCPPSLGLLSLNALTAVREVFIPLLPHFLALQGLGKLLETITLVNRRVNPDLRITGILLCMYDKRTTLSGEVRADIEAFLERARDSQVPWANAQVIPVHVRRNIKLAEAPSHGKTIFEYEPNCNGAADYLAVAKFVHTEMGGQGIWTLDKQPAEAIPATGGAATEDADERLPESGQQKLVPPVPTPTGIETENTADSTTGSVSSTAGESETPGSSTTAPDATAVQKPKTYVEVGQLPKAGGVPMAASSPAAVPAALMTADSASAPSSSDSTGPPDGRVESPLSGNAESASVDADESSSTESMESTPEPTDSPSPPEKGRFEIREIPVPTHSPSTKQAPTDPANTPANT